MKKIHHFSRLKNNHPPQQLVHHCNPTSLVHMAVQHDDFYYYRKSGQQQQIPAFGDWENVNELPITQYFECARQAGLLRCSCSSCATNVHPTLAPQTKETRGGMNQHSKEQRTKQVKVVISQRRDNKSANLRSSINAKPVDEDLYKIPSELLQNSKRGKKRMLGFFSRCMVPPCAA